MCVEQHLKCHMLEGTIELLEVSMDSECDS